MTKLEISRNNIFYNNYGRSHHRRWWEYYIHSYLHKLGTLEGHTTQTVPVDGRNMINVSRPVVGGGGGGGVRAILAGSGGKGVV